MSQHRIRTFQNIGTPWGPQNQKGINRDHPEGQKVTYQLTNLPSLLPSNQLKFTLRESKKDSKVDSYLSHLQGLKRRPLLFKKLSKTESLSVYQSSGKSDRVSAYTIFSSFWIKSSKGKRTLTTTFSVLAENSEKYLARQTSSLVQNFQSKVCTHV